MDVKKFFAKAVENWAVKVLSIGLAIFLFVIHRISLLEERFFFVPLHIEQAGTLAPSSSYPRMIRVVLRGDAAIIHSILEEEIEAFMDLSNHVSPGTYHIPVQWRKTGSAAGIEPLQISVEPAEIVISLDYRVSRFIPVTASFRGSVLAGYSMSSFSLNPGQVIVDGPARLMGDIFELFTEQIDLDGRNSDFSMTVNIAQRDPLITIRGTGTTEFRGTIIRTGGGM